MQRHRVEKPSATMVPGANFSRRREASAASEKPANIPYALGTHGQPRCANPRIALIAILRNREIAEVGKSIEADTHLTYRETRDGDSVHGV